MDEHLTAITEATHRILEELPPDITLVAAAKSRSAEEVSTAIEAGVTHVGHNYVQEAQPMIELLGDRATWHMIGHLQSNKAKRATHLFDVIETVDSWRLAKALERYAAHLGKTLPVLIEVNSGREANKTGALPEDVEGLARRTCELEHLQIQGLMTMGPRFGDPEKARPFFQATREIFHRLDTISLPNMQMLFLSMGMSNSYRVAIEEGANIVRIGTKIFGTRES
jgi:pyridoxal phosphate enzyme (YggS family)